MKHLHLESNTEGRDIIIGDLHGHLDELTSALNILQFDPNIDRIISCGDLIDRGPNSLECAQLIYEPYFFAVKGNHEELMEKSIISQSHMHIKCWMENGGTWAIDELKYNSVFMLDIANKFKELPLIISLGERKNRINIVHAELTRRFPANGFSMVTDDDIDRWNFTDADEDAMMWGRTVYDSHINTTYDPYPYNRTKSYKEANQSFHSPDLSLTLVGHTFPLDHHPVQLQRQLYIDTGMCAQQKLTLVVIANDEMTVYQKQYKVFSLNTVTIRTLL
jgi:serine/threonine protein phosphatase 1